MADEEQTRDEVQRVVERVRATLRLMDGGDITPQARSILERVLDDEG